MPTPARPWLPYAALGIALLSWSTAYVAIRHVTPEFRPGPISLGRHLVAVVLVGFVVLGRGMSLPRRRDWGRLAVMGALMFAVFPLGVNEALRRVDAGTVAILIQASPIVIVLLAVAVLGERPTARFGVGLAAAFTGICIIGTATSQRSGDLVGVVMAGVSCCAYAVALTLQKPMLARVEPVTLTWLGMLVGVAVTLPYLPQLVADLDGASFGSVAWIVYVGVFPTALALTMAAYALRYLSASTVGTSTYFNPVITLTLAWLLLGETPAPAVYIGGALCLTGVWWALRPGGARRPRTPPEPPAVASEPGADPRL